MIKLTKENTEVFATGKRDITLWHDSSCYKKKREKIEKKKKIEKMSWELDELSC